MFKKLLPWYLVALIILSLAFIYGCGSAAGGGGGGGGGGAPAPTTYRLSVTVTPDATWGTVEANPNLSNWLYLSGKTVELTATGLLSHVFSSWESGKVIGDTYTSPASVTMTATKSIKAYFRILTGDQYLLIESVTPDGAGTIEPWDSGPYPDNTSLILTAEANPGYIFSSWEGSLEGTSTHETILMNTTKEVTAVFKHRYSLSVAVTPEGYGTVEPWGGTYTEGAVVPITATANPGYVFNQWSGDASGSSRHTIITMESDKNVTAEFTSLPHLYSGVVTGMFGLPGTNCLTGLVITSDASPQTFYMKTSNEGFTVNGTWELLSSGFSTAEWADQPLPYSYFYESTWEPAVIAADPGVAGSAIIWTATPTKEPVCSGSDYYNLMQLGNIGNYDYWEGDQNPVYFRSRISGSGGSYTSYWSAYYLNGNPLFSEPMPMDLYYTSGKFLYGSATQGGGTQYMRLFPSPSNMIVGSSGNDRVSDGHGGYRGGYQFMVGGKEHHLVGSELDNGQSYVGLMMSSSETQYIAAMSTVSPNQIWIGVIDDPGTNSSYGSSTHIGTITLGTEKPSGSGAYVGTIAFTYGPESGNTYQCATIVAQVGPNQDKLLICGFVSMEATDYWEHHQQYKSANFFLIQNN